MYQKKFIERREQQIQIINRQIAGGSDDESRALAYAMKTQVIDSSQNLTTSVRRTDSSLKNNSPLGAIKQSSTSGKPAGPTGLETLRKVHDSLGNSTVRVGKAGKVRISMHGRNEMLKSDKRKTTQGAQ